MDDYGEDPSAYGRFAAVYNFVNDTIEVYWAVSDWPSDENIYMKTLDLNTGDWSDKQVVVGIQMDPTFPSIVPSVDAIFNKMGENDYVTYLAYSNHWDCHVTEVKDGRVLHRFHKP